LATYKEGWLKIGRKLRSLTICAWIILLLTQVFACGKKAPPKPLSEIQQDREVKTHPEPSTEN